MAVGDYNILPFAGPVGPTAHPEVVRGNDETLRQKFVEHQNDTDAHIVAQSAPSAPTGGTVIDSEARAAINDILAVLAASNITT